MTAGGRPAPPRRGRPGAPWIPPGEEWLRRSPAAPHAQLALVFPGGYEAAMASLGYLAVLGEILDAGAPVHRVFLLDGVKPESIEEGRPLGSYRVIAVSLAWELEVPRVIAALQRAGIPSEPAARRPADPLVVAGGALTLVNPRPLLWFADVAIVGDGIPAARVLAEGIGRGASREEIRDGLASLPGALDARTARSEERIAEVMSAAIQRYTTGAGPLASPVVASGTAFGDSFLVEACRGCPRGCSFCVLRRDRCGPFAAYPTDGVLDAVPAAARRVGLVGAGVSDHPCLAEMLERLIRRGLAVSTSSLRVGALDPTILRLLSKAGGRRITVGIDGMSERLRRSIGKPISDSRIVELAEAARRAAIGEIKLYVMVGVPGEEDRDVAEFAAVVRKAARLVRIAVSAGPLVPKPRTPLAHVPMAPQAVLRARLAALRRALGPIARIDLASPRTAAIEHAIAFAGPADRAVLPRVVNGCR